MAKASAHIAPGNAGYFSHNSRQSFSQSQVFFDEENEIGSRKEEAFEIYRFELKERSAAYKERVGQNIQKKTVTHLSAVVNLEQHHTLEDLKPLTQYIENELDTKVLQEVIHRDEGKLVHKETGEILTSGEQFFCNPEDKKLYFDEEFEEPIDMSEWNMEKNYHAHIEFVGLASDGKSIKRELTTWFFRKLQDKTAEVLGMERGQITKPTYTKEQMKEIKAALKPKKTYADDKAYGTVFTATAKKLGYWKPKPKRSKRKDTHDYKAAKAQENELTAKALAKQKDLKAEIARLRIDLQDQKAKRSDYAALEQLNKDLKEKIKQKDLLLEDLKSETEKFQLEIKALKELAYTTEEHWMGEEDNLTEIVEVSYKELYERATDPAIQERYEFLENKMAEYGSKALRLEEKLRLKDFDHSNQIKALAQVTQELKDEQAKNTTLNTQNKHLKAKIATLPTESTLEELNTLKIDFEKLGTEYWELYAVAYDEEHEEQVFDDYGILHDKVFSYKDRYEESELKNTEKDEEIKTLKEGYSEIEKSVFGDNEDRTVEKIIEHTNTLATVLSNISKYLKIGMHAITKLFSKEVPGVNEVQKEQLNIIKSSLATKKKKDTSSSFKPNNP